MNAHDPTCSVIALAETSCNLPVHRFSHAAMATVFGIHCIHPDETYARQAAGAAFYLVDRLEQDLSRFRENSDISRINHLVAGESARIGIHAMECLQIARLVQRETSGAFDISIGSGFESIELDPRGFAVHAHADGIRLDLGAIGKGYAVDRMAELLEEWGIAQSLLHGGYSSVLALDPPPGSQGWPLSLSLPGATDAPTLERIAARRQAFSGSGIQKQDHIIDPRIKQPVRSRPAAWVSASVDSLARFCRETQIIDDEGTSGNSEMSVSPAAVADALSTAFMILSPEEIEDCCRRHPGLEVWILMESRDPSGAAPSLIHLPEKL